jgi:outer membrane lipoprotein LolB
MKFISLLLIILFISSCSNLPKQDILQPLWETHRQSVDKLDTWKLNGRIFISDVDGAWNARVIWQQQAQDYQLVFNSPMGGAMRLTGSTQQVMMRTADNQVFTAETPEQLVKEVLNMEIPVQQLRYWIKGIPAPTYQELHYFLNKNGQLQQLEQSGWVIDFKRYININGLTLPEKIFLQNNDYRVKIAINRWHTVK